MEKSVLGNLAKNREVADLEKVGGVKGIAKALGSSVKLGYKDDASVRQARETYGSNHLPERKTRNFLQHLIDALWVSPVISASGQGEGCAPSRQAMAGAGGARASQRLRGQPGR